jgi:16S rRNA (guanine966-N2)-methyltransferase
MPDRVRESLFNMLGVHCGTPGALPPLRVADVFAGSGSNGLEALSRGAMNCIFFERDRTALAALQRNLTELGVPNSTGRIVAGDAWKKATLPGEFGVAELIFLDPPFVESDDPTESGAVHRFLAALRREVELPKLVVLHHESGVCFGGGSIEGWKVSLDRTFGSNRITFFEP